VLRTEDIDSARVRPGAAEGQISDLHWLGFDWDEGPDIGGPHGPYKQSQRAFLYEEALERLKQSELVYPCTCTRAEIERAASAPHAEDEGPTYPGLCAHRSAGDAKELRDRPFTWRFRVPAANVEWDDLVRGKCQIDPARLGGDFIVGRSTGAPAYQLAVVVDDAAMRITQVVRGDDLIPSTPRQILLHRALGIEPPRFGHVPLVIDPYGRRLAKRDESIKLRKLHESGVNSWTLIGTLARSCGFSGEVVPSQPHDWLESFSWEKIPREPWVVSGFDERDE
jgi:glutamyl-tRNA synthetase